MALSSADNEARAYRNASPGLRLFLTAGLSVALMVLDHRGTYLEQIRSWLGTAIYPVQIAIDSPATGVRWMRENLALRSQLIGDNADLRREALINQAELQRLAALQAENARIRALLDSKARVPNRVVVGEILDVGMDPLHLRVILNKGRRDGAYEGQALLDAGGIVGQITRALDDSSEVILVTDPDHALPVEVLRNGLRTIAVGTGDLDRLSLPFLTRNADIRRDDLLVTSGLGGAFPAGYPVGKVTLVDGSSGDAFLEINAEPAASLSRLHEVLLVFAGSGSLPKQIPTPVPPAAPSPTPTPTPASKAAAAVIAPADPAATPVISPEPPAGSRQDITE